jgi:hypothetical protein
MGSFAIDLRNIADFFLPVPIGQSSNSGYAHSAGQSAASFDRQSRMSAVTHHGIGFNV